MRNRPFAAVFFCALGLAGARVGAQETGPAAVLWVPPESFSDWASLDRALARKTGVKLTVGLSPGMVTPEAQKILSRWSAEGRLETALRVSGDPILPLIAGNPAAPRPEDPVRRIALEREKYRELFGAVPAGFVPGGGAVGPELFGAFQAMGFSWVAAGDYAANDASWAASSNVVLVPLKTAPEPSASFVVDEADGLAAEGTMLKLLESARGWRTVAEAVRQRRAPNDASAVPVWPTWSGGYDLWSSSRAWSAYAEAAQALERYQDSGSADMKTLESATDELYLAQAARYFRVAASSESAQTASAERELRTRLIGVYRKIRQTPPESLYASLGGRGPSGTAAAPGEPASTDIHFSRGPSWLAFDNPTGSFSRSPEEAASDDLWQLRGLRVDWSGREIVFNYRMKRLEPNTRTLYGFGSLLLDTYIDLNHVAGAGSASLLDGREAFAQTRDAWEYALVATGSGAALYRSSPRGPPALVAKLPVSADLNSGELKVTVPVSQLRGNPARWGYIAAAMALDPGTTNENPPKPLAAASGSNILGILAPLEQQKALAEKAESGRRRLAAVRAR